MKNIKYLAVLFVFVIANQLAHAQDSAAAGKWVKSKVWAKGLKIKADPSINSVEFKKQYESNKELWDKAFKFLGDPKLATLAPGKYMIDGDNAYAIVTEGAPKKLEDAKWESHRKYIDLQYVVAGKVKIGVAPVSSATVTMPYDETKDLANYTAEGTFYTATPDIFFLFFPQNAHRPDIKIDGFDTLKKLVIKIRYKE